MKRGAMGTAIAIRSGSVAWSLTGPNRHGHSSPTHPLADCCSQGGLAMDGLPGSMDERRPIRMGSTPEFPASGLTR